MSYLTIRMKRHTKLYGADLFAGDVCTLPVAEAKRLLTARKAEHCLNARYPHYNQHPRELFFRPNEHGHITMQPQA